MKVNLFSLGIFYSSVYIYDNSSEICVDPPIEDIHCRQGFSWFSNSSGGIVFGIPSSYSWECQVFLDDSIKLAQEAVRAIQLPFKVTDKGVFLGSGGAQDFIIDIPIGNYMLTVEQGYIGDSPGDIETGETRVWCRLWFNQSNEPVEPKILVQDAELNPQYPLRLDGLEDDE